MESSLFRVTPCFGARIIAIRLLLKDIHDKDRVGNALDDVCNEYLDKLTTFIVRKHKLDIFIIGTDANTSMGTASARSDGPLGCFRLNHVNESGKPFLSYHSINNLAIVSTFSRKINMPHGSTLIVKRHQIDHFIINKEMLHRCIDAGITSQLLDSDHCAIFLKLRVMRLLKRKIQPHQHILNLDHQKLSNLISDRIYEKKWWEISTVTRAVVIQTYPILS